MKKVLIASGCSFTFENWNWPGHLSGNLGLEIINVGMGSQGNGLISRKLIYIPLFQFSSNHTRSIIIHKLFITLILRTVL